MRVLYVGHYLDPTGWGQAARDSILALDAAGVEVVPRPIKYAVEPFEPPGRIRELQARPDRGCDAVVQNVLPSNFDHDRRLGKNVGYFFTETSDFASSSWPRGVDLMDEAWAYSRSSAEACRRSGVTVPVRTIPCAADTSRYLRPHRPFRIREELGDAFAFYTIGEARRRKNFQALLVAFHTEFDPDEPVELVVQSTVQNQPAEATRAKLAADFAEVKKALCLYPDVARYKREQIVADYLSYDDIARFHSSFDCYVSASYAEGWGLPAFDAMGFGKTPIVTRGSSHVDFMTEEAGWLVDAHRAPVVGMQGFRDQLYNARQDWDSVDIHALRRAMRQAYEDRDLRGRKSLAGMERAQDFSYAKVGRLMREALES